MRSVDTSLEEIFLAYYGAGDGVAAPAAAGRRPAMLLRNVFGKTIRDLRWPTFWVALGMGVMTGYFAMLFPTYKSIVDLGPILAKMGPAAKLIGGQLGDA